MQEVDELRPAPRRTPTAVLWLMGIVFAGGTGLLLLESPPGKPAPWASVAAQRPPLLAKNQTQPPPPAGRASSSAPPNLSDLQVP